MEATMERRTAEMDGWVVAAALGLALLWASDCGSDPTPGHQDKEDAARAGLGAALGCVVKGEEG